MAVTTITPDATVSGIANYNITGATYGHSALSDNSDSTYIAKKSTVNGAADCIFDFSTFSLTASQTIKQIRLRARCSTPTVNGKINVYLGARISGQNYFFNGLAIRGQNTSATTFVGPYFNSAPDGTSWSQTNLNAIRARVQEYKDSTDIGKIYDLFVDVDVRNKPSVTITAPTGSLGISTPDISWSYTDTDGDTQQYYQYKIFSAAQYNASGFNYLTSTTTYDSGQIASSDQTAVVSTILTPASYRMYMRVGKDINAQPFWSDWNTSDFTVSYNVPTTPTMLVAYTTSFGYSKFTVQGSSITGTFSSQYFEVQRSDDSGITWADIDLGTNITPNAVIVGTTYDYEAPRGETAYYRARAIGVDSNSNLYPSGWSITQQVLITNDNTWWFKCPDYPALNQGNVRVLQQLNTTVPEPHTIFRALGTKKPVVVAGPLQGEDGEYQIKTVTEAEWTLIKPVLEVQAPLLVQDPLGNQKYIRIYDRTWTAMTVSNAVYRDINIKYVEVSA